MKLVSEKHLPLALIIVMWISCLLFYSYQYFLQVSPAVMTEDLLRDFHIDATVLGYLAGCYFYTYALMQIPIGLILDRFGARRPAIIASFLCALGCFFFAATNVFWLAVLGRLLIGFGAAFAVLCSMYVAAVWLPLRLFAFLCGIILTVGMIAASLGQAPLALLVSHFSWRFTMLIFGGVGLLISFLLFILMRDQKEMIEHRRDLITDSWLKLKAVLKSRQIWLVAIQAGLVFMTMSVFGSLWGVPFLMKKFGIDSAAAGFMVTMIFIGTAVGSPFLGWVSDFLHNRKLVMILVSAGSLFFIWGVIYFNLSQFLTGVFLFGYGFFIGGMLVAFALAREQAPEKSTGVTMGFVNTLNMVGGAFGQPLVGVILDYRWKGLVANGIRNYSYHDYQVALVILPLVLILSLLTFFWIRNKK
jgi:MFS family permease